MKCKWLATGGIECGGGGRRGFEAFADLAQLGQRCEHATCARGSGGICYREKDDKFYCKRIFRAGESGCSKPHSVCLDRNTTCVNDKCVYNNAQPNKITNTAVATGAPIQGLPQNNNNVIGIILISLIMLLIILVPAFIILYRNMHS